MTKNSLPAKNLAIFGAGGHGRVVADIAELLGYNEIVFYDNGWPQLSKNLKWTVGGNKMPPRDEQTEFFVAIGENKKRLETVREILRSGCTMATLVHPQATVSQNARLGAGTVIMPGAVVNAGAHIGVACIANTACTIDHDCDISDGVHVSPGANIAGGVSVGETSWIGIGSTILENRKIGNHAIVAAGAVVVTNVLDGASVFGIPARERTRGNSH